MDILIGDYFYENFRDILMLHFLEKIFEKNYELEGMDKI